MTRQNSSPVASLPVRPRQRRGETADSYLRRLAAANHLRFSYLRRYLAIPRGSYGPIDPGQMAALAGREPRVILRAFPELAPSARRPGTRRYTRENAERNHAAKRENTRPSAATTPTACPSGQSSASTASAAALSSRPSPRQNRQSARRSTASRAALKGLHGHIDEMIEADPAIGTAAIWQYLADDHGVIVAYPTLRTYVTSRRAATQSPVQPPASGPE